MAVLAVDIGGTNIRTALYHSSTQATAVASVPIRRLGTPFTVDALSLHLDRIIADTGKSDPVTAIGVAIAAVVEARTGYVKVGENVGWRDVPLKSVLEARWPLRVSVDVDAFCGALAEAKLGAGQDLEHFLYLVIGTGIGHGLVLNRRVWHGMHSAANVFGHLKVEPNGEPCYCGGSGCVCQYASGNGLARLGQLAANTDAHSMLGPDVVTAYHRGELWAEQTVEKALYRLAFALSNVFNLLDIECAVIGGGAVSAEFPNLERLLQLVEPLIYPEIRPIVLRRAVLGDKAVLTGAALLAFDAQSNRGDS